jgi:hypothetical protein
MFTSLETVVEAARQRLAALTPEVAGYVVLLATQRLGPRPTQVSLRLVLLTEGGDVQIQAESAASELEVETGLRGVLAILLALSPSPVPAISAVAEGPCNGSLSGLLAELSAALIPINHAAAHRALARLYRETIRARALADETRSASESAGLDPLGEPAPERSEMGMELAPAPPPVARVPTREAVHRELDIDVDLDAPSERPAVLEAPHPSSPVESPVFSPPMQTTIEASGCRSDLRELLLQFLSDTRSEERMMRALREMIGLEDGPPPLHRDDPNGVASMNCFTLNATAKGWPA